MTDHSPSPSDRARLDSLAARIKTAATEDDVSSDLPLPAPRLALSAGRVGFELMAAILAGAGLGWLLDGWLDSAPWGALGGLVIGFAGGAANVWRALQGADGSVGYQKDGH